MDYDWRRYLALAICDIACLAWWGDISVACIGKGSSFWLGACFVFRISFSTVFLEYRIGRCLALANCWSISHVEEVSVMSRALSGIRQGFRTWRGKQKEAAAVYYFPLPKL